MNDVFRPYLDKFVIMYLDDILVFSKTAKERRRHLRMVFELLRKHQLFAEPRKCELAKPSWRLWPHCGHAGTNPTDNSSILEWPIPPCRKLCGSRFQQ